MLRIMFREEEIDSMGMDLIVLAEKIYVRAITSRGLEVGMGRDSENLAMEAIEAAANFIAVAENQPFAEFCQKSADYRAGVRSAREHLGRGEKNENA